MRVKVAVCSSEMTVSNVLLSTSRTEKCSTVWWTDLAAFCTISAGKSGHSSCSRERYSRVVSKSERQQPHTEIGRCFNPTSGLNSVCLTVALKSHLHSCRAVCSISRKSWWTRLCCEESPWCSCTLWTGRGSRSSHCWNCSQTHTQSEQATK